MLKIIGIALVVAVAGFLVYAAMQPEDFRIQRSTTVNAPPERIYPLITDFRVRGTWSPWENKEPAMKRTFSEPASGVGAVYAWEGNKAMCVFMNMEKMVGPDFEAGLARLKAVGEKPVAQSWRRTPRRQRRQ